METVTPTEILAELQYLREVVQEMTWGECRGCGDTLALMPRGWCMDCAVYLFDRRMSREV